MATAAAATAINTPMYINIGGDKYTSTKQFKENYGLHNDDEAATELRKLFDGRTGDLYTDMKLTRSQKAALEFRIHNIAEQLLQMGKRYTLLYQPLRNIKKKLEEILVKANGKGIAENAPVPTAALNTDKQTKLKTHLMTLLLKIGYFATHSSKIDKSNIGDWNTFLNATNALTGEGKPLNIASNTATEKGTYTVSTNAVSNKKYRNVREYITGMTTASAGQTAYETQVGTMLNAMVTYQFIEDMDKENFESKNTSKMARIGTAIQARLKARFLNSMMVILEQYKTMFGPAVYSVINTQKMLSIFKSPLNTAATRKPTVQENLSIIEGILNNVYAKLYSPATTTSNDALGIYKFDEPLSKKLLPLIRHYAEQVRGTSVTSDILGSQPMSSFAWFIEGKDIINSINPAVASTGLGISIGAAPPTLIFNTFRNFITADKDKSVFLIVNRAYTPSIESCYALLHTYGAASEADDINIWNAQMKAQFSFPTGAVTAFATGLVPFAASFGGPPPAPITRAGSAPGPAPTPAPVSGPTFRNISITSRSIPDFDIQRNLCMPMYQLMTTLAAVNQTMPESNRYASLGISI